MKTRLFIILAMLILCGVCHVRADTVWDSGHHEILDGETYHEIWMCNDATADMWGGGDVYELGALDTSRFNMFGGTMDVILVQDNSIVNIYGGSLFSLDVYTDDNGLVNLYAYDVVYHPTGEGGYDYPWMGGKYISNDQNFAFMLAPSAVSHINIVPEPATFFLFALGGLFLKRARKKSIAKISS